MAVVAGDRNVLVGRPSALPWISGQRPPAPTAAPVKRSAGSAGPLPAGRRLGRRTDSKYVLHDGTLTGVKCGFHYSIGSLEVGRRDRALGCQAQAMRSGTIRLASMKASKSATPNRSCLPAAAPAAAHGSAWTGWLDDRA